MKNIILFFSIIPLLFVSCSKDSETITPKVAETLLNVSYGASSQQKFDLYLPANRSVYSTKTLILVHGGGWIEGDKADMGYFIPILQQVLPEYAIANVNYRLASKGNYAFPMQTDDIKTIINKLKSEDYSISDNFGFIGTSAGAHLSLLHAYSETTTNNIKMVASIVGPTNFADENYTNNPAWLLNYIQLTGVSYSQNPMYFEQLSPLFRATSASPPTILFYGNADPLIPTTQGIDLQLKLNQLGVYNEFNLYEGGHGNWSQKDLLDANIKLIAFIRNNF